MNTDAPSSRQGVSNLKPEAVAQPGRKGILANRSELAIEHSI